MINAYGITSVIPGEVISSTRNTVAKATHITTGEKLIVKTMPINPFSRREVEILSSMTHQHLAKVYSIEQVLNDFVIVMKMEPGSNLVDLIRKGPLTEPAARDIFLQLLEVVTFLHCSGIIHRDIKLDNILLDQNQDVVLIDFEFACYVRQDPSELEYPFCGTTEYAAPELRFHKAIKDPQKIDIWSLGVVLYTLVVGYFPFSAKSLQKKNASFSIPSSLSNELHVLLKKLLEPKPTKRPTCFDLSTDQWLARGFSSGKIIQRLSAPTPSKELPKSSSLSSSSKSSSSQHDSPVANLMDNSYSNELPPFREYVNFSELTSQTSSSPFFGSSSASFPFNPYATTFQPAPALASPQNQTSFYQNSLYPSALPQDPNSTSLPPLSSLLPPNSSPPRKKQKGMRRLLRSLLP
eukprot:TRINITY_DN5051_c0_g1_i1.p1 TRINITY_DN5051_c0_g1~~TRINITY_DN5051_c0_g1_i1.p1  ORF type:complete len:408 (-),score=91.11 TRINITY_DN5051_c0_g1_i1:253-1476(-)